MRDELDRNRSAEQRLQALERSRLAELEQVVDRGLDTFVEVGLALREIRDSRLYRETYSTFEAYLDDRWQMSRPRGYQLIGAAGVAELVSTTVDTPLANEAQARELVPLLHDEDEQAVLDVYRQLLDEYGAGEVTAGRIRRLVRGRLERTRREQAAELARARGARSCQFDRVPLEAFVDRKSPRDALLDDVDRLTDGLERLRRLALRESSLSTTLDVPHRWMPFVSIGPAMHGKRSATPDRKPAADLLAEVHRDLLGRAEVVETLRKIEGALEAERAELVAELERWLSERVGRIGATAEALLDALVEIAEGLPDTPLEWRRGYRSRSSDSTLVGGDFRDVL
jgi:hypothetical protein